MSASHGSPALAPVILDWVPDASRAAFAASLPEIANRAQELRGLVPVAAGPSAATWTCVWTPDGFSREVRSGAREFRAELRALGMRVADHTLLGDRWLGQIVSHIAFRYEAGTPGVLELHPKYRGTRELAEVLVVGIVRRTSSPADNAVACAEARRMVRQVGPHLQITSIVLDPRGHLRELGLEGRVRELIPLLAAAPHRVWLELRQVLSGLDDHLAVVRLGVGNAPELLGLSFSFDRLTPPQRRLLRDRLSQAGFRLQDWASQRWDTSAPRMARTAAGELGIATVSSSGLSLRVEAGATVVACELHATLARHPAARLFDAGWQYGNPEIRELPFPRSGTFAVEGAEEPQFDELAAIAEAD